MSLEASRSTRTLLGAFEFGVVCIAAVVVGVVCAAAVVEVDVTEIVVSFDGRQVSSKSIVIQH